MGILVGVVHNLKKNGMLFFLFMQTWEPTFGVVVFCMHPMRQLTHKYRQKKTKSSNKTWPTKNNKESPLDESHTNQDGMRPADGQWPHIITKKIFCKQSTEEEFAYRGTSNCYNNSNDFFTPFTFTTLSYLYVISFFKQFPLSCRALFVCL